MDAELKYHERISAPQSEDAARSSPCHDVAVVNRGLLDQDAVVHDGDECGLHAQEAFVVTLAGSNAAGRSGCCSASMAKSTRREKVKLISTAGTGFYYTLNKLKGKDKLLLKKYDPKVKKHVDFKEGKLTK